jgi:drug/metabolite transporter (DMT)-like permease
LNLGIYFAMLLVPIFWGGAFGVTKHALTEVPPLTLSAFRFLLAGILMALWVAYRGEWRDEAIRNHWLALLLLGATGVLGYNYFFAVGLQYTTAINAALIVVINPVTTALVAVLFLGERWSARLGLGVFLSLLGVLTVNTRGDLSTILNLRFNFGELMMLGAVASWTSYTSIAKILMKKTPPTMATAASTVMGALLLVLVSVPEGGWGKLPFVSGQVAAEILYLIIFPSVVAFIIYNTGVRQIGASKASSYINLMPVNAVLIAALLYGETVTPAHLVGMVLVVAGVVLTTTAPGK